MKTSKWFAAFVCSNCLNFHKTHYRPNWFGSDYLFDHVCEECGRHFWRHTTIRTKTTSFAKWWNPLTWSDKSVAIEEHPDMVDAEGHKLPDMEDDNE